MCFSNHMILCRSYDLRETIDPNVTVGIASSVTPKECHYHDYNYGANREAVISEKNFEISHW